MIGDDKLTAAGMTNVGKGTWSLPQSRIDVWRAVLQNVSASDLPNRPLCFKSLAATLDQSDHRHQKQASRLYTLICQSSSVILILQSFLHGARRSGPAGCGRPGSLTFERIVVRPGLYDYRRTS